MCSINHDLKAIFIHIHKTGGTTIAMNLKKYYGFSTYYLRRPDHTKFCFDKKKKKYINYENRVHGVITYYKTSPFLNKKMKMTPEKWDTYYKFCFVRDPYDRIVSAWNHVNRFNIPFQKIGIYGFVTLLFSLTYIGISDKILVYDQNFFVMIPTVFLMLIICAVIYVSGTYLLDSKTRLFWNSIISEFVKIIK